MMRVGGIRKRFGAIVAVDGLDFVVEPGETFALIGPNGAGKTTTLKMLLGLTRPDAGRVLLGPDRLPPHDPRARRALGYVPQRVEFAPARTVLEVLRFFADLKGLERKAVGQALERVGLESHAARRAGELSGGYTQRLSLAQALLGDPSLLILDEPTGSLDPEATWEFRSLVERLREEGKTIVLSSHLLTEVERIADRVLILLDGRAVQIERLDDLRQRQLRASRLKIETKGEADAAEPVLRRLEVPFERPGPREILVGASNGRSLEVLDALRLAGVELRSFHMQGPTLEETFLSVVRGGRRDA
jgi:ABC-type multidrug transport system ATPase subunit